MAYSKEIDNNIEMSENCTFFSKFVENVEKSVDINRALKGLSNGYSLSAYKIG